MLFAPAFVVSLSSAVGFAAGAALDLPVDFPISAPEFDPEVVGYGHGGALRANEPTILFINFDGARLNSGCGNNPKNNCSSMTGSFGGEIYEYAGSPGIRASLVQGVRSDVADFGVTATDSRPSASEDYAMVLVGESAAGGSMEKGFAGVAPTIDCGNSNPNITSFDLVGSVTVINQEAAHTWGLEHVNEKSDNLYPTSGGVADPIYNDECMKIVSDTMLTQSSGRCNSIHTMFCNSAWQNSYQEMLYLFGPGTPDTVAPTATIENPAEGETLPYPANFNLTIALTDNDSPQLMQTAIFLDGAEAITGEFIASTLQFPVNGGISEGTHTWRVETTDEAGNPASDEVSFTLGMAGPTTDGPGGTAGGSGSGSGSGGATSDSGGSGSGGGGGTATTDGGPSPTDDGGGSSSTTGNPGDTDTDGGSASGDDSSCSCRTPDGPVRSAVAPLIVVFVAAARRRRGGQTRG